MKKIIIIAIVLAIAAISAAGTAWAGERSKLISEDELNEIQLVAKAAYPRGVKLDMVVDDALIGNRVVILFITGNDRQYLGLEVYPILARAFVCETGSREILDRAGDKIVQGIERVLNRPAKDELKPAEVKIK